MGFVEENYKGFKGILHRELKSHASLSEDFYDDLVLRLLPEFQKATAKDDITRIIRVELLNELRQDELPEPQKLSRLSGKLLEHYQEIHRDQRSERLNNIHRILGLILIVVNILAFATVSYNKSDGFSLGAVSLILGLIIWWSPALSGLLAFYRSKSISFSSLHFIWLLVNVGLIYVLVHTVIEVIW